MLHAILTYIIYSPESINTFWKHMFSNTRWNFWERAKTEKTMFVKIKYNNSPSIPN